MSVSLPGHGLTPVGLHPHGVLNDSHTGTSKPRHAGSLGLDGNLAAKIDRNDVGTRGDGCVADPCGLVAHVNETGVL